MRMGRFVRQLHRILSDEQLGRPAKGDGIVLAVSGGPDSMALLHGLAGANHAFDLGLRLHVAHLNHQTRGPDSDADAAFVTAEAERLGLPVAVESVNVPAQLGPAGGGLERAGRNARYEFFARVARREKCRLVATGHHAEDNAETILQRIIRGTGPRGLAGIPPIRPLATDAVLDDGRAIQLIRPLLAFRRRLILRFLQVNAIPFRTDASNLAPEPMRNWLRGELIPLIERHANPGLVGSLLRLGELSGWVSTFLEETARRTLTSLVVDRTDIELTLNAAGLAGKRQILQAELIRQAIMSLGPREAEIGMRHLKAVMRLAGGEQDGRGPQLRFSTPGQPRQVNLPGGMIAEQRGGQLVLRRSPQPAGEAVFAPTAGEESAAVNVPMPGRTILPNRRRQIVIELLSNSPDLLERFKATRGPGEELIDADRLRPPLLIRRRRPGDRFWPLGASGTKKVSDFLSDRKVPPMDRDGVCLLCDQLGPVWVIPHRIDDRVRVTERSRNLARLRVEPV